MASSQAGGAFSFARRSDLRAKGGGGNTSKSSGAFDFGSDSDGGVTSVESDHPDSAFESEGSCDTSHEASPSGGTYQGEVPVGTNATSRDATAVRAFGGPNATHRPAFPTRTRTPVFTGDRDVVVESRGSEGGTRKTVGPKEPGTSKNHPRELRRGVGTEANVGTGFFGGTATENPRILESEDPSSPTRLGLRAQGPKPLKFKSAPVLKRQTGFTETSGFDFETSAASELRALHRAGDGLADENAVLRGKFVASETSRAAAEKRLRVLEGKTAVFVTHSELEEFKLEFNERSTHVQQTFNPKATEKHAEPEPPFAVDAESMRSIEGHVIRSLETAMRSVDIARFVEGLVATALGRKLSKSVNLVDRSVRESIAKQTKQTFSDPTSDACVAIGRVRRATRRAAALETILTAVEKRTAHASAEAETALRVLRDRGYFQEDAFIRAEGVRNVESDDLKDLQSTMGDVVDAVERELGDLRRVMRDESKRNAARCLLTKEECETKSRRVSEIVELLHQGKNTDNHSARRIENKRAAATQGRLNAHTADMNCPIVTHVDGSVFTSLGRVPTGSLTRPLNSTRRAFSAPSKLVKKFFLDENGASPASPACVSSENVRESRKRAESTVDRICQLVIGGGDVGTHHGDGTAPVQLPPRLLDFESSAVTRAGKSALTFSGGKGHEPDSTRAMDSPVVTARSPRSRKWDIR